MVGRDSIDRRLLSFFFFCRESNCMVVLLISFSKPGRLEVSSSSEFLPLW
jgi:hypothetical protein